MLEHLADILHQTGKRLLDSRSTGGFTYRREGAVVSASVDMDAHHFLVRALSALSPGVPVLSEEDSQGRTGERPDLYWLIDPLDGTASFIDGFPGFVTQAALVRDHRPALAGVYAPVLDETFLAESGGGATRNGKRLKIEARPADKWVLTDNYPTPRGIAADLIHDWDIPGYLECGSIGLKICRVAEGHADLFVKDVPVRDWDVAAPQLVLEEAGGRLRDGAGRPFPYAGGFEHVGLIACASADMVSSVAAWLKEREIQCPTLS